MTKRVDKGPPHKGPKDQGMSRLLKSLQDVHEADHQILDALGIRHPHVPILGAVEMLEHLLDAHAKKRS